MVILPSRTETLADSSLIGKGSLRLAIHAENLLPHSVRPAGEEARLGWRGPTFHANNSGNVRAFATEIFDERVTLGVLANGGDGKRACSQVGEVVRGVGASARDDLRLAVAQNQNRRLARDAGNVSELKFVGNKIAEQHDRLRGKFLDAFRKGEQVHGGRRRLRELASHFGCLKIQSAASPRFSAMKSGGTGHCAECH